MRCVRPNGNYGTCYLPMVAVFSHLPYLRVRSVDDNAHAVLQTRGRHPLALVEGFQLILVHPSHRTPGGGAMLLTCGSTQQCTFTCTDSEQNYGRTF